MNNNPEYLSKEGLKKLKEELRVLSEEKRKEIAERLEQAIALGDLSENSEYQDAKEAQSANEMRIAELGDILQRAQLISKSRLSDKVSVGSFVKAAKSDGKEVEFMIVGAEEADPVANKISHESPIGKALMGKERGQEAVVHTPKGATSYKIVHIA